MVDYETTKARCTHHGQSALALHCALFCSALHFAPALHAASKRCGLANRNDRSVDHANVGSREEGNALEQVNRASSCPAFPSSYSVEPPNQNASSGLAATSWLLPFAAGSRLPSFPV